MENEIGLTGCKWSSLNAPGTETLLSHPSLAWNIPFSHLVIIRNWHSRVWKWKVWTILEKDRLNLLQVVQIESLWHWNPFFIHFRWVPISYLHICDADFCASLAPCRIWQPHMERRKAVKKFGSFKSFKVFLSNLMCYLPFMFKKHVLILTFRKLRAVKVQPLN